MAVKYVTNVKLFIGLSSDDKPSSGVPVGSRFYETDTGDTYITTDDGTTWVLAFNKHAKVLISDGAGHYLQLPTLTTAQRDALTPVNGMQIYNSTLSQVEIYANGAWRPHLQQKLVVKSADETVNNSATLQNDDELKFAIGANEVWRFQLFLLINSGATPDFKYGFTMPTGGDVIMTAAHRNPSNTSVVTGYSISQASAPISVRGIGVDFAYVLNEGIAVNGATPGNLQLQWAQNTADASDTKLLKNSMLLGTQLV